MSEVTISQAEELARAAHAGQVGRDGSPFIDHPRRVAEAVASITDDAAVIAVALLHDTVEKGGINWGDLRDAGMGPDVLSAVDALTKRPGETDEAYASRCRANAIAFQVKRYDLLDKLRPEYLGKLSEEEAAGAVRSAHHKLADLYGDLPVPADPPAPGTPSP